MEDLIDYNGELFSFLPNFIKENNLNICNSDIYVLASWVNYDIGKFKTKDINSTIESIKYIGKEKTYDLSIKDGRSFIVNGILAHNTTNLPNSATIEDISNIYIEAWKAGCKGITVFRDGCKEGVFISNDSKKNVVVSYHNAVKRPKVLNCEIHYSNIQNKKDETKLDRYIFLIGLDNNSMPYEILGGKIDKVLIPKKYKTGFLVKNGKNAEGISTYDLVLGVNNVDEDSDEKLVIKDIASEFKPDQGSYTRMFSLMLRHGVPLHCVCEQILKDTSNANLLCFEKCIVRILKKYIKDGEKSSAICIKCNVKLIYRDGCTQCPSCGESKCS